MTGSIYSLAQFTQAPAVKTESIAQVGPIRFALLTPDSLIAKNICINETIKALIIHGHNPEDPSKYPSRSEGLWAVICWLVRELADTKTIAGIILNPANKISDSVLDKANPRKEALGQIKKARKQVRPVIRLVTGKLPQILDRAEMAMQFKGTQIFQRSGNIVRIGRLDHDQSEDGIKRHTGALIIMEVSQYWLREQFMRASDWIRPNSKGEWCPADPKLELANHYLARCGEWRQPVLKGIIESPTLRRDFSLLDKPGYDRAAMLIFDPGIMAFPPIKETPSRDDAMNALNLIVSIFRCFPFIPDAAHNDWKPEKEEGLKPSAARSVALSMVLTGLIRRSLRTAPLHGVTAPEKGTGKGLIADIVSIILTGRCSTVMSQGYDANEDQKRLFSILMQGDLVVVLDNIERPVEGDALCSVLTQEEWQCRILGESRTVRVPTNCLMIANGNNLTFRGDMTRRVVVCQMDAKEEKPDEREFTFDPRELALEKRAEIVCGGLTMIRAYIEAGRPLKGGVKPLGSFEEWTIIREVLLWLGQPDPANTREQVLADDPAKAQLSEVMEVWAECFDRNPMRINDVMKIMREHEDMPQVRYVQLHKTLSGICARGKLDPLSLGWWFRANASKVVDRKRFIRREDPKRGAIITLEHI